MDFEEQLRGFINNSGLTSYRIGKTSGVSQSAIDRFMRKERGLTSASINRLTEALELELVKKQS